MGRNTRAGELFHVQIDADVEAMHASPGKSEDWRDWARLSEGGYLLRSNVADWSAEELWRAYIQLTEAEAAFRIHKSDLLAYAIGGDSCVMRPLRYSINVTLDGCCDHRAILPDEELHRHANENLGQADALLFGRMTYEMMEAAFRPRTRTGVRPRIAQICH
ncbi:MAG TPA: hypothetical protein VF283_14470 [Bryobacteraceae bacterium]